ncbi:MAG TPA: ferredoxin reductase [Candidatus Limnocylindria bacterium]|nr:ferredoxin reductase [Candidatus Limnocylindria bacterium]
MKRPLEWQIATVTVIRSETPEVKTLTLALPDWTPHRPGQHYDIRLTADDGYSAQRSYSIASEPERRGEIDITVERVPNGEVSTFLLDTVVVGDRFEVRGPIGGYFVWDASMRDPLLLVAGGSGVVPLMAMLRHRAKAGVRGPARLLYSARSHDQIIYRQELEALARQDGLTVSYTLTRAQPPGWRGYARRIDDAMLREVSAPLGAQQTAFVCGPTALVEVAADGLERVGLPADRIRTERFGPSGT